MKPAAIFLSASVSTLVFMLAVLPSPTLAGDAASKDRDQVNTAASYLLDGTSFKGPTGEKGKKTHHEDVLVFKDGQFTSSMCFEYGFTGSPYTAWAEGDLIHFEAETISPTHGKMNWKGTLQGNTMEVEYSWTKERWLWTTYREYWFKGTIQK